MKRPSKEIAEKYHAYYPKDSIFSANARLLQSIWRERTSNEYYRYGNYIAHSQPVISNFLTKNIFEVVQNTIKNKENNAVIQEDRLYYNMLSSQPLAFNLFGELSIDIPLATRVFVDLFPDRVHKIESIIFEHSPERGSDKYTQDYSAFDVFVEYISTDGQRGFFGIEVKYAENMKTKPAVHKDVYDIMSIKSQVFQIDQLQKLRTSPLEQIWRDHLLSLSMYKINHDYNDGLFIFLYPKDNIDCMLASKAYKETFLSNIQKNNGFCDLEMESLLQVIAKYTDARWVNDFKTRYLSFE